LAEWAVDGEGYVGYLAGTLGERVARLALIALGSGDVQELAVEGVGGLDAHSVLQQVAAAAVGAELVEEAEVEAGGGSECAVVEFD